VNAPSKGKWTAEEDAMLIDGVTKLGEDWIKVAVMFSARRNDQCRRRWVNVLEPTIDQTIARNKGRWIAEEDAKLIEGIKKHSNNWVKIAVMVPSRTNVQSVVTDGWRVWSPSVLGISGPVLLVGTGNQKKIQN
jgi:hypothetical protein